MCDSTSFSLPWPYILYFTRSTWFSDFILYTNLVMLYFTLLWLFSTSHYQGFTSWHRVHSMPLLSYILLESTSLYQGTTSFYHVSTSLYQGSTSHYALDFASFYHSFTSLYHGYTSLYFTLPWLYFTLLHSIPWLYFTLP